MSKRDTVTQIIFGALNALNAELDENQKVEVSEDTPLFGANAALDSLSLVSVVVDVEGDISKFFNQAISLTDDDAMGQEVSPFTNVRSLTDFILSKLQK